MLSSNIRKHHISEVKWLYIERTVTELKPCGKPVS